MGDFRITNGLRPLSGARRMRERRGKMTVSSGRDEIICWSPSLTGVGRLIVAIVVLVAVLPADAQMAGEMVSVLGKAEVLREGRWQALNTGGALKAGEVVQTGEGSRIAIQFANGPQLKLNANSRLELKEIEGLAPASTSAAQIILRLITGEMRVKGNGNPLEVQTLPATAIIRGTEYNLAIVPPDSARLAVLAGLVEFANPQGSVLVAANEQATAKLGEAPRKTVLLNPLDAVQWSLYYPDLDAGQPEPDRIGRADPRSPRHWTEAARDHLLRGQVPDARRALDRALMLDPNDARAYGLRAVIELVQNRKAEARADAERAVAADPVAPEAHLALSWVQQAEFDLDGALASARRAVELAPDDPHALIQESRLLFGLGRVKEAFKVAEKARQRAPKDAVVNATWGFLQLARNRNGEAIAAFEDAIAQDSTRGEPHLGLGIALFQRNRTDAAVEEMRKATLLEPSVSLYNSYLGKAYYEVKQDRQAEKYLALAKQLDPLDPTPHFYDAIRRQSVNQPVEAVRDLQKSIELNDNRAVYRSRLLLDQDLAARDTSLARVYDDLGFEQLAQVEASKSLALDPANYSAHRFLSDSYATRPRHEIARVSELLQAQLLQPININPVQPSLNETNLKIINGFGTAAFNEYTSLFERDRTQVLIAGIGGNNSTLGEEVVLSGLEGKLSYSLGQYHYETNGFRDNADLRHDIYNAFVQVAVTPQFNLQAEYRWRETESGDLGLRFDDSFERNLRSTVRQDTARFGAHFAASSQSDMIFSVIHGNLEEEEHNSNDKGYQMEAQYLFRSNHFNLITGIGGYDIDHLGSSSESGFTAKQRNAYAYANFATPENLIWTFGLGYNALEQSENQRLDLDKFNPKFGLQWHIADNIKLRLAAFRTLKPRLVVQQTIEPSQIAGFNQLFDGANGTTAENYGVGLDFRLTDGLYVGMEGIRRDLEIPEFNDSVMDFDFHDGLERLYFGYFYWTPHPQWTVSGEYRLDKVFVDGESRLPSDLAEIEGQSSIPGTYQVDTTSVPLIVRYFNPSGFFSELGMTYVHQKVDKTGFLSREDLKSVAGSEDFILLDAVIGYRLPKRRGIVSLAVRNLLDKKFHHEEISDLLSPETENPRFIPERLILSQFTLNF